MKFVRRQCEVDPAGPQNAEDFLRKRPRVFDMFLDIDRECDIDGFIGNGERLAVRDNAAINQRIVDNARIDIDTPELRHATFDGVGVAFSGTGTDIEDAVAGVQVLIERRKEDSDGISLLRSRIQLCL